MAGNALRLVISISASADSARSVAQRLPVQRGSRRASTCSSQNFPLRSYTEGTLEQFELTNKPGALAELAGRLAKKGINIDCAYATVHKGAKKAVVVLGTSKEGETGGA